MNDKQLGEKIDLWIEEHLNDMVDKVMKLVEIKSVSDYNPSNKEEPFGAGCKKVLDKALEMSRELGFPTKNYDYYCGTALLKGKIEEQIGIFAHLDIVPEGNGWSFDPYKPFVKDGFIFGRGTTDNKGAAVASLFTLKCLKDLGVDLKHSVLMFYGCSEELGMHDVRYYFEREKAPVFSFTSDAEFSMCHGEKGILEANLVSDVSNTNLIDFHGGDVSNMVPDSAYAIMSGLDIEKLKKDILPLGDFEVEAVSKGVKISAKGFCGHAAFPENAVSATRKLAEAIDKLNIATGNAKRAVHFISEAFADCYGEGLGIACCDDVSGKTTHIGGRIRIIDGKIIQNINVRYAIKADQDLLISNLKKKCADNGFKVEDLDNNKPTYMPLDNPVLQILNDTCNEVLGSDLKPYVMGGGTYARKIPNAIGYGPGIRETNNPFCKGKGSGHQPDEVVMIKNLANAIKIYTLGILRIDKIL